MDYSAKIIKSWNVNAEKWITTINNAEIVTPTDGPCDSPKICTRKIRPNEFMIKD